MKSFAFSTFFVNEILNNVDAPVNFSALNITKNSFIASWENAGLQAPVDFGADSITNTSYRAIWKNASDPAPVFTGFDVPTIVHLHILGQSQADGYLSTPAITTGTVANAFALGPLANGRTNFITNFATSDLIPLQEYDINGTRAETIATSMAQQLLSFANDPNLTIVVSNSSQNSQTVAQLGKGGSSGMYERAVSSVERVSQIAAEEGKDYQCHLIWYHGGGGENPYASQISQLFTDFRSDVAGFTTQANIKVFSDQQRLVGSPDYSIQTFETLEADPNGTVTHPRYTLEYGDDNVHLTNHGSRHAGVLFAQGIYKEIYVGGYSPLSLSDQWTFSGGKLTIPVLGQDGALAGNGDFGVEVYNLTDSVVMTGSWAINGSNIVFTPDVVPASSKTLELRVRQGSTGELYSTSGETPIFNNSLGNPYLLDKYLVRHTVTAVAPFVDSQTHTLTLTESQSHTIDFATNYPEIVPGDVVVIPAGTYTRLRFENFVGDANNPLTIINGAGGRVNVTGSNFAIGFYEANHIKLTGTGSADQYGFQLHPTTVTALSSTGIGGYASGLEIEFCEIYDCGFAGFFLKKDLEELDSSTWRRNYVMEGLTIHNNYIHDVGGEGMYLGTTRNPIDLGGDTALPHEITNCHVYDNILNNCGWDGIQLSRCTGHKVYGNVITNYGTDNQAGQNKGIAIANGATGEIYNNLIDTGIGSGIDCFGDADNKIYNNIIIDAGENGIFINDNTVETTNAGYEAGSVILPGYVIASNTVIRPAVNGLQINGTAIDNKVLLNNIVCEAGGSNVVIANGALTPLQQGNVFDTVANLVFVDALNDDYRLGEGSPAIDAGVDLSSYGITTDYNGSVRPSGASYDAGVYESASGPAGPTNNTLPNIGGTETELQVLTVSNGTWSGVDPLIYTYQWTRDNINISGATFSTYSLVAADVGTLIRCKVTATDANGSSTVTTNPTGTISALPTGTTEVMHISMGRANQPQVSGEFAQINDNNPDEFTPSVTQNGITLQAATSSWLSSINSTYLPPSNLQGFPAEAWQNGWYSRYGGVFNISGLNDAKTYNLIIAMNCPDGSTSYGTAILVNGTEEYNDNGAMSSGTDAKTAVISNMIPQSGQLSVQVQGSDPGGTFKFGHICGLILEEN